MIRRALFCVALCCAVTVPALAQAPTPMAVDPIVGVWKASNPSNFGTYTFHSNGTLNQGQTWKHAGGGYTLTLPQGATATAIVSGHTMQVIYVDRGQRVTFTKVSSTPK